MADRDDFAVVEETVGRGNGAVKRAARIVAQIDHIAFEFFRRDLR